ncbi:Hypothetical predicted protein [Marmota monax]|uniref:Ribosome-binding factor A, mitochondrial n=1 Tax=Marmota monax TaxID=9995 RepID=A0A5E4D094_MARMO|nr:Hypothetical predicted protein [Marmota monax]
METYRPSKLDLLLKRTSKRTRKEDHVRLRALNGLLHKALTDLLSTPEVSQEVYNLNVELSKVSLTPDFSACRVYWKVSLSADQNKSTEATLQRSAAHMRHLLMSQQTLRNVPPIVFIQDRKNAALAEIDGLLAVAEFGPPDEGDHPIGDDPRPTCDSAQLPAVPAVLNVLMMVPSGIRTMLATGSEIQKSLPHPCPGGAYVGRFLFSFRDPDALSPHGAPGPASCSSLCGIDHEALSKQIMEYKRRKERGLLSLALRGQEQGAEPTQLVRRRRRNTLSCQDKDSSPRSFLLGEDEDEDKDYTLGCECQTHEAEQEWGADPGDEGAEQGPCGRTGQGQG